MNLHNIASAYTGVINPWITVSAQSSNGYTTSADYTRIPAYRIAQNIQVQRQSLTYDELKMLNGLNIQGTRCKLYLNGTWNSVVRSSQDGGDLFTFPDGTIWLCVLVMENWAINDGWQAIVCTLQNGS